MAKTVKVRAIETGGVPRRRQGEIFDAPAGGDGKLRADYASWCEVVDEKEAEKHVRPSRPKAGTRVRKVKGEIVQGPTQHTSGGGQKPPAEDLA